MKEPDVSVVVCTRNRPDSLARTLDSLSAQTHPDFEVVVVDQSDDDRTRHLVEGVEHRDHRFRGLYLDTPGLSRAYNRGVGASRSGLIAFTDDDCVAPPDWLHSIIAAFAAHPEVPLLYGQVLLPPEIRSRDLDDGTIPTLPILERQVVGGMSRFKLYGMGADFAARRHLFQVVGGFDEVLGGGGPLESSQDFDFMYRVFRSGCGTLLEPSVRVYHYGFRSSAQWPTTMRSYGIGVGGFFAKHVRMGDVVATRLMATWLVLAACKGALQTVRGSAAPQALFARSMVVGALRSLAYDVDHRRRVYTER